MIPDNYQAWSIISASLEQSAFIMGNLSNKDNLDKNDTAQLIRIKELLDVYIDMRKSNTNTGFIDDQSMLTAEKAAEQFNKQ